MDFDTAKSIILSVMTLATIGATVGVGLMFGSLRTLRDTAGDLRARVTDLEAERVKDKAKIAEQAADNKTLTSMVTGKVEWTALIDLLGDHHKQAVAYWKATDAMLENLPSQIAAAIREELNS